MKLTIEPTSEFMRIEGSDCRVWEGQDENGTPIKVWVRFVSPQTHDFGRLAAFEETLKQLPKLEAGGMVIDHRFVAD